MRRLISSIDRWGPALLSVITLFWLVVYSIKVGRIEGQLIGKAETESELRTEIQTLQAYVNSLEKTIIKAGIDIPGKNGTIPIPSTSTVKPEPKKGE